MVVVMMMVVVMVVVMVVMVVVVMVIMVVVMKLMMVVMMVVIVMVMMVVVMVVVMLMMVVVMVVVVMVMMVVLMKLLMVVMVMVVVVMVVVVMVIMVVVMKLMMVVIVMMVLVVVVMVMMVVVMVVIMWTEAGLPSSGKQLRMCLPGHAAAQVRASPVEKRRAGRELKGPAECECPPCVHPCAEPLVGKHGRSRGVSVGEAVCSGCHPPLTVFPCSLPAYVPEEELKAAAIDEGSVEDGLPGDVQEADFACSEEAEIKEAQSYQNSPISTATNQDAGYGSPFSEHSDQPAHFKSSSSKEEKEERQGAEGVSYPQDSLAQIKAVYANLFSESCWSSLALDLKKSASTTSTSDAAQKEGSTPAPTPPTSTAGATGTTASTPSSGSGASGGSGYDWHQAALAKTLQQTSSYGLLPEPSLFSTVQLYRQNNKLYGSVFTGASKFRCKDCSAAYDTLVELTVHMNETGHYRDDNRDKDSEKTKRWSKPRKRSLMEMEGKEDAQKVLKCMYCGHSFESLQDLSVHMIKTKHYQKVPLKEPVPALTKLVPSTKKRALHELAAPGSPEPAGAAAAEAALSEAAKEQKTANPYVTPNNRYGYQNGASYTWQFEARKAQILKCMECGSSHDTLQQLTAHMMVTGHFLKVTTSASKKGKQLVLDPVVEEKIQSIPLPPTTHTRLPAAAAAAHVKKQPDSPAGPTAAEEKKEPEKDKAALVAGEADKKIKEEGEDAGEKFEPTALYQYLREEDLDDGAKGGVDILKSLENTVSTAISKAQNGAPSWGGYPSIHAAYQLPGTMKPPPAVQSVQMQPSFAGGVKPLSAEHGALLHSPGSLTPPPHKSNVSAMEELVEKVTGKVSVKKEERPAEKEKGSPAKAASPAAKENKDFPRAEELGGSSKPQPKKGPEAEVGKAKKEGMGDAHTPNGTEPLKAKVTNGCNNLAIITDHSPEPSFINPLSALQSIMNTHLGKVSRPVSPSLDPLAMLYKISTSMLDKPAYPAPPAKPPGAADRYFYENSDQPIDLTKSKSKPLVPGAADGVSSPLRESALMDISDMVKNLTGRLTPKSSTPSTVSEKSDADGSSFEEALDELSPVHKRKGRQSNWNPQHLLILQAQFASSLRETAEGKYIMSDLGPQERVHISKFTGLSMTTISHWLANVKYQLRRTGGTKFLKNLDTGHPVFFCNDCASQFRTASTYINHLETHLGFSLKDLSKLPLNQIQEQQNVSKVLASKALGPSGAAEDELGSTFQCKLCNRTFASKHAVKLHLSKTHGKSPEDHLIYVTELEKQ
ncbi:teashirt homolog 1 [Capricornis sumatraensis]|uniref:teashirt homolog 1 n=1 Tax=Capricornis sumatraensis TaxID=34865 RepID=UPI003605255C